jgi:hypothetical protein
MIGAERGTIVVNAIPINGDGYNYRIRGDNYDIIISFKPRESKPVKRQLYNIISRPETDDENIYTPCVVKGLYDEIDDTYSGGLLVPPDVTRDSDFFQNGLIVPSVELDEVKGLRKSPRGYIMKSPNYLGQQKLFAAPNGDVGVDEIYEVGIFQALIIDPKKDDYKRNPFVLLIKGSNRPDIVEQNRKALLLIKDSENKFWWDFKG